MYAGDSNIKRSVRFRLYDRVRKLWSSTNKPKGKAIVLCGTEAADVGALVHILDFSPKDIVVVDNSELAALKAAKARWPGIATFYGDVSEAIKQDSFSLVNLDFCGFLKEAEVTSLKETSKTLVENGVCSYTFLRGREHSKYKRFVTKKYAKNAPDEERFEYYLGALKETLAVGEFSAEAIFQMQYTKQKGSFGVVSVRRTRAEIEKPIKGSKLWKTPQLLKVRNSEYLVSDALSKLIQSGLSLDQAVEAMNMQIVEE